MFADDGIILNAATAAAVGAILLTVSGALTIIFRLLIAAKDTQIADLKNQMIAAVLEWKERCDSFKRLADKATETCEVLAARYGTAIQIPRLAPVIPEHNSPTTPAQQFAADSESIKARLLAARLVLETDKSLPPPKLPVPAPVPGDTVEKVEVVKVSPEAAQTIRDAANEKEGGK